MPATTRRSAEPITEPVTAPVSDDADQLRALVSAMLSGTYKEEFYLWDVASLCRAKPDFARQLLALIDRYRRLGQMPAAQHQKIKEKIEQTAASRAVPLSTKDAPEARTRATTTAPLPTAEPAAPANPTATANMAATAAPPTPVGTATPVDTAATAEPAQRAAAGADSDAPNPPTAAAMAATAATRPVSTGARDAAAAAARVHPASEQMTAEQVMAAVQRVEAMLAAPARSSTPRPTPASPTPASPTAASPNPAHSTPTIAPGTVLCNRYALQTLLGSGGMGSVYRALDRYRASLGMPDDCVALKIVTAQPPGAANALALVREFHNAQQLSHPNVINVYEIDHQGDASFYTMELLDGERLSQLLERIGGPLPKQHALSVLRDIGAAMAHAHSRGVAHGDLKPHNIFITYGGQVRVLDFGGLSHSPLEPWIADPASPRRGHSYRTATPAYASCEQLEGQRADPRDDIYAMACMTYELLTGRHPFDCKSSVEARAQRLRPSRPPGMHAERWRALRHALAWERAQRPAQIERWLEQVGVSAAAGQLPPTHQLTAAEPRRPRVGRAVTAAVLLLALGGAVFAIAQQAYLDWDTTVATARTRLQHTWQQWLSTANGDAPADAAAARDTAPATPVPALAAPTAAGRQRSGASHAAAGRATVAAAAAPARALAAPPPRASDAARAPAAAVGAAPGDSAVGAAAAIGVRFAASSYRVADMAPAARVVVRRTGSARDAVRFVWWTEEDSAKANVDYAPLGVRTEDIPSGADHITIYIPIISNPLRHQTAQFYVALGAPGTLLPGSPSERAIVTIERGG